MQLLRVIVNLIYPPDPPFDEEIEIPDYKIIVALLFVVGAILICLL